MPKPILPLLWFSERDKKGHYWCAILTSDDMHPEIRGRDGLAMIGCHVVLIWAGQDSDNLDDTLVHEMAHVHCWVHNRHVNEREIQRVIPHIMDSLRIRGWRRPPMPRGYGRLAAHARRVRAGLERDE